MIELLKSTGYALMAFIGFAFAIVTYNAYFQVESYTADLRMCSLFALGAFLAAL
jgi:hypothetical protein